MAQPKSNSAQSWLNKGFTAPNPSFQPTRYTRREQRYLAVVSPFVGWRTWPVTGGG